MKVLFCHKDRNAFWNACIRRFDQTLDSKGKVSFHADTERQLSIGYGEPAMWVNNRAVENASIKLSGYGIIRLVSILRTAASIRQFSGAVMEGLMIGENRTDSSAWFILRNLMLPLQRDLSSCIRFPWTLLLPPICWVPMYIILGITSISATRLHNKTCQWQTSQESKAEKESVELFIKLMNSSKQIRKYWPRDPL